MLCHPPALWFSLIFVMLWKKCLNKWVFFSCDAIPPVENITNLPQRKLWWNAILPYLLESPHDFFQQSSFRKMFTFFCDLFLQKKTFSNRNLGKLLNHKFPNLSLNGNFFQWEIPYNFWGCSQPRHSPKKKHRPEPETLRADMLLKAPPCFFGKKQLDGENVTVFKGRFLTLNWGINPGHGLNHLAEIFFEERV